MINLIAGLELPSEGEIWVDGRKVEAPGPDRGVVYQTTALFPFCTVMGNVEFGPKSRGIDKKTRRERAQYFIDLVGLQGFEKLRENEQETVWRFEIPKHYEKKNHYIEIEE